MIGTVDRLGTISVMSRVGIVETMSMISTIDTSGIVGMISMIGRVGTMSRIGGWGGIALRFVDHPTCHTRFQCYYNSITIYLTNSPSSFPYYNSIT